MQTLQFFYNPDPYQRAYGGVHVVPDEQRSWFDIYLPALDSIGAASCCGTSCLVRAEALKAIGGFPTESICEDTLSTIKMRKAGWKTVLTIVSLFFLVTLVLGCLPAIEPPQRRRVDRFRSNETFAVMNDGRLEHWKCRDISIDGALFETTTPRAEEVQVCVDNLWVDMKEVRRQSRIVAFRFDEGSRHDSIRKLYCANAFIECPKTWSLRTALAGCARRVLWT